MSEQQMETRVALIERDIAAIVRDAEKREKVQDARHAETMATLKQLGADVSSGRDFNRGAKAVLAVIWAAVGAFGGTAISWFITRGPT